MVDELATVLEELGGEANVGHPIRSNSEMAQAIRKGFLINALMHLTSSTGFTLTEVSSSLNISLRSLQRRKSQGRLQSFESERVYRLARIIALASTYLGNQEDAIAWLKRPNHVLGNAVPLSMIDTELGARQVEDVLGRIAYGGVS